ncbi:MAG: anthranilate phosphoribosyltransferase, partial [Hyphomonas sp.]|nr:anthranilate phosphoribosyltransferase [Hyphomonas sp.]
GPLSNPAGAEYQVLGVFAPEWVRPMAETLSRLGTKRAWVVHGLDGIDEISIAGITRVCEVSGDDLHEFELTPADAGLETSPLSTLEGSNVQDNALAITELLDGQEGPFRDVVLLNAAAGLHVFGKADNLKHGVSMAAEAIDSGKARQTLRALAALSNGQEPE